MLFALGAEVVLAAPRGRARGPVEELIVGHYTTVIEPDELLVEVRVPPQPALAAYRKFRSRTPRTGRAWASRSPPGATARGAAGPAARGRRGRGAAAGAARGLRARRGPGARRRAAAEIAPPLRRGHRPARRRRAARPPTAGASSRSRCAARWRGRGVNERVDGAIRYAIDVELPGMLHARLVGRSLAPARVTSIDASGVPGDVVCLLPDDVRDLARYGCLIRDQDVLPQRRRPPRRRAVAAVAARDRARRARRGATSSSVDYDELPGVYEPEAALAEGAPLVHDLAGLRARERPAPATPAATPATASGCCTAAARRARRGRRRRRGRVDVRGRAARADGAARRARRSGRTGG